MVPNRDQILEVGDDLHIACVLTASTNNETSFNVYGIKILLFGKELPPKAVRNYQSVNNSLDVLVPNVTVDESGAYWCNYTDRTQVIKFVNIGSKCFLCATCSLFAYRDHFCSFVSLLAHTQNIRNLILN